MNFVKLKFNPDGLVWLDLNKIDRAVCRDEDKIEGCGTTTSVALFL